MNLDEARKILGLTSNVNLGDIRQAFRKMAFQYHPDRYRTFAEKAWATRQFVKIKAAYDLLMTSTIIDSVYVGREGASLAHENLSTGYAEETRNPPFGLFCWILNKLSDTDFSKFNLHYILGLILTPIVLVFLLYCAITTIFQGALNKCGLELSPYSRSKARRSAFLIMSTVTGFSYLIILYWVVFTRFGETSPSTLRIAVGFFLSFMVVLLIISEWVGFFLSEIWRRPIQGELEKLLPQVKC